MAGGGVGIQDILSIAQASGQFANDDLVDQSMTILAAGHKTTSSAMTWALIKESLTYLHAFSSEVLRFHAPVPLSRRECVRATTIMGRHIPEGTSILLVPAAVNLSKNL